MQLHSTEDVGEQWGAMGRFLAAIGRQRKETCFTSNPTHTPKYTVPMHQNTLCLHYY